MAVNIKEEFEEITVVIFLAFALLCIWYFFSYSEGYSNNAVKGKIIEISTLFGKYNHVKLRVDCHNPSCEIKNFYFKKITNSEDKAFDQSYLNLAYVSSSQLRDIKVVVKYGDYILFNVLENVEFSYD